MALRKAVAAISLLAATSSGAPAPVSTLQWQPCNQTEYIEAGVDIEGIKFDCAVLPVPLDYTKQLSNETLPLSLVRVLAPTQPAKGSVLLNFGGPGLPARHDLVSTSNLLQALSGGAYNLIAFDPRGTGNTIPFECSTSPEEAALYTPRYNLGNSSDTALGHIWASATLLSRACVRNANATGRFLSTAFVARDLMSVVDALGEDGLLRFWGLSYGTTLGATVLAMFPDRIDKVLLDGVQNPHLYYNYPVYTEQWSDADATFEQVFVWCLKTPAMCPFVQYNQTAPRLAARAWAELDNLKFNPITAANAVVVDQDMVQPFLISWIRNPRQWPLIVALFDAIFTKNTTALDTFVLGLLSPSGSISMGQSTSDPLYGISCADTSVRSAQLAPLVPFIREEQNISRLLGDIGVINRFACAQWGLPPAERYGGNFDIKSRGKVLVAGNTWDSHTAFRSARNLTATIEGSGLLEVAGHGHTTLASPSLCSLKTYSAFWRNGTLPKCGKPCKVEGTPFSGIAWENVLAAAAGNSSALPSKRSGQVKEYRLPSYLQ